MGHRANLADAGAAVVGDQPAAPIGLSPSNEDASALQQLADRLWGEGLVEPSSARDVLKDHGVGQDFHYAAQEAGAFASNTRQFKPALEVAGAWQVAFDPHWGGRESVEFVQLIDWSESDDRRIRYYSGTAVYANEFELPEGAPDPSTVWLDLGEVKKMARIYLKEKDLGVAWTAPFRIEATSAIQRGRNRLRIEVVNLWPNRLIGDALLPWSRRLTKINVRKFQGNETLLPSGLLGPVRLLQSIDSSPEVNDPTRAAAKDHRQPHSKVADPFPHDAARK